MNLVEESRYYKAFVSHAFWVERVKGVMRGHWVRTPFRPVRNWRYKAARHEWGREMATALSSGCVEDVASLLNNMPGSCATPDKAEELLTNKGWWKCIYNEEWCEPDADRTWIRNEDGYVSESGYDNGDYYCCEGCGDHYSGDPDVVTEDCSDRYHSERCARNSGCCFGDDGGWYSLSDNAPCDDNEDEDEDGVYSYDTYLGGLVGVGGKYNVGVEIEIEFSDCDNRGNFVSEIYSGHSTREAHCKHDGSLDSYGVEVATGYGLWGDMMPIVKSVCRKAKDNSGKSHNTTTCGQHISVSRASMSHEQQARFVVFFNLPDNQDMLKQFARRTSSYAEVKADKCTDAFIQNVVSRGNMGYGNKYEAVNHNHRTHLEVRIFKGTLRFETIAARMALVALVAEYCEKNLSAKDLKMSNFLEWLSAVESDLATSIKDYLIYRNVNVATPV
jgi:hypothetical protein